MSDPILPWPVRHPALLDSAGAPVLLVAPDAAPADQPGIPLECPTEHTREHTPACVPLVNLPTRRPDQPRPDEATEPPPRMAQIVTPSALLSDLLARCLRTLDLSATDTADDPDLVVLDLAAPDALARCHTLREQHPDLPIVALTPLVTDHLSAWEAGANAVLPIPFDVLDLRDLIRVLLRQD